jgi:hypothetical protein
LYPGFDFIPFRKYVSELIDGTARRAYAWKVTVMLMMTRLGPTYWFVYILS